ncbi:hypothetical protein [Paenibacillus dendritiformis]|uniref:hypothetical protein n=1 Tax=Paenibacillus dendritiformis TaxID=130049 RepID=UPI001408033D
MPQCRRSFFLARVCSGQLIDSIYWRLHSRCSVSIAKVDFPELDGPVTTTSLNFGISTEMNLSRPSTLLPWIELPKTAKMQFFRMSFIPLRQFLQNGMNFNHANGLKAKIG